MKKVILGLLCSVALGSVVNAQTKITYKDNALIPGDERTLSKFDYVDNSVSGPAQVWDFSNADILGTFVINQAVNKGEQIGAMDVNSSNTLLACDEGSEKDTYFEISRGQKMYWGLKGKSGVTIQFDEPIVDLPFPFAYGDIQEGVMNGTYTDKDGKVYPIEGQYFTTADAWGKIFLPDGSKYENVLRVKVEKYYKQAFGSFNYDIHTTRYQYFAPGVRYPVMIASIDETKSDCNCACGYSRNEVAYFQPEGSVLALRSLSLSDDTEVSDAQDASFELSAYPNPFKEVLIAKYASSKAGSVAISIIDANGKLIKSYGEFYVEEGTNTVTLNTADLGLGHYILRAVFAGQEYTQTIVKK